MNWSMVATSAVVLTCAAVLIVWSFDATTRDPSGTEVLCIVAAWILGISLLAGLTNA